MTDCRRPRTRGERGAAAVEFALVVPLLLMLIFGAFDFARAMQSDNELGNAAREGAREGSVNTVAESIRSRVAGSLGVSTAVAGPVGVRSLTSLTASCTPVAGMEYTVCVTCKTGASTPTPAYAACPASRTAPQLADGTIRVQVIHTYQWVTPISGLMKLFGSGVGNGVGLSEVVEMRIE